MKQLKHIKAIRVLAFPYENWKRRRCRAQYLCSPDHFYLKTLKGIYRGERCFIIGNGPSLRASDLDMLKKEHTFAANRIFKIFDQTDWRPTYYLSVDDKVLKEIQHDLSNYDLGHMFLKFGLCTMRDTVNKLTKIYDGPFSFNVTQEQFAKQSLYISEDISDHFCNGSTVTFYAIQLAIYMGFKEIYLLGVDHNYSRIVDASGKVSVDSSINDYFDNKKYYLNTYPVDFNTIQLSYTIAKEYCDNHGIIIRNATRGGKLEVFDRVNFDKLMKERKN